MKVSQTIQQPKDIYNAQLKKLADELKAKKAQFALLAWLRFFVFLGLLILGFYLSDHLAITFMLLYIVVAAAVFLSIVKRSVNVRNERRLLERQVQINERERDYLQQQFQEKRVEATEELAAHSYAFDLDLIGKGSLFTRIDRSLSDFGRNTTLKDLLTPPLDRKKILERQEAIQELSERWEWRQKTEAVWGDFSVVSSSLRRIKVWLKDSSTILSPWHNVAMFLMPALNVLGILGASYGVISWGQFIYLPVLTLVVVGSRLKEINRLHAQVSACGEDLRKYAEFIAQIEGEKWKSERLKASYEKLVNGEFSIGHHLNQLSGLINYFDSRLNIVAAILLNSLLSWDFHLVKRLEKWKSEFRNEFDEMQENLAEWEMLMSYANYRFNHPDFVFPELVQGDELLIEGEGLGHPFLSREKCVSNRFNMKGDKIFIITGANMAGKSTYLRSVGTCMIMSRCGLPVFADKVRLTPASLFASLRTSDNLQKGESFFFAEVKRLGQLVDQYKSGKKVFFLLDEILKGTNSKDQHIGALGLLKKLEQHGASGVIATHDLGLAQEAVQQMHSVTNYCFEINQEMDKLIFDYTIKEGICSVFNAQFIMREMGIIE